MDRKPVVALESTIITHGMAYPQNLRWWILMFLVKQSCKNEACNWWISIDVLGQPKTFVKENEMSNC